LHGADAHLAGAVEVGIVRNAEALRGEDIILRELTGCTGCGHVQWPVYAMPAIVELVIAFHVSEMRQHVLEGPAAVAAQKLVPVVVVLVLAAGVDHGVDRRATAEHGRLAYGGRTAVEMALGNGLVHLHHRVASDAFHPAGGHRQEEGRQSGWLGRAALEHQNPGAPFVHQAPGCDTGRGTTANNDIVKGHL
jgi:hypothetical protein